MTARATLHSAMQTLAACSINDGIDQECMDVVMNRDILREQEIRLNILESLARSQQALALIAETISEAYTAVRPAAEHEQTAHELAVLACYQIRLAEQIMQLRLRNTRLGTPVPPWLHRCVCPAALCGEDMSNSTVGRQV